MLLGPDLQPGIMANSETFSEPKFERQSASKSAETLDSCKISRLGLFAAKESLAEGSGRECRLSAAPRVVCLQIYLDEIEALSGIPTKLITWKGNGDRRTPSRDLRPERSTINMRRSQAGAEPRADVPVPSRPPQVALVVSFLISIGGILAAIYGAGFRKSMRQHRARPTSTRLMCCR